MSDSSSKDIRELFAASIDNGLTLAVELKGTDNFTFDREKNPFPENCDWRIAEQWKKDHQELFSSYRYVMFKLLSHAYSDENYYIPPTEIFLSEDNAKILVEQLTLFLNKAESQRFKKEQ